MWWSLGVTRELKQTAPHIWNWKPQLLLNYINSVFQMSHHSKCTWFPWKYLLSTQNSSSASMLFNFVVVDFSAEASLCTRTLGKPCSSSGKAWYGVPQAFQCKMLNSKIYVETGGNSGIMVAWEQKEARKQNVEPQSLPYHMNNFFWMRRVLKRTLFSSN